VGMENSPHRICPPKNINRLDLKRGRCSLSGPVPALRPVQPTVQVGAELRCSG